MLRERLLLGLLILDHSLIFGFLFLFLSGCFHCGFRFLVLGNESSSLLISQVKNAIRIVFGIKPVKLKSLAKKVFFAIVLLFFSQGGPKHAEIKSVKEETNDCHLPQLDISGGPITPLIGLSF